MRLFYATQNNCVARNIFVYNSQQVRRGAELQKRIKK
jgi:hypothetical protein